MNARATSVAEALELFVPPFEHPVDRWDEVAPSAATRPKRSWRRPALLAAAVALAATLIATPAFGIRGLLADLIGRIDVTFTSGRSAPLEIKRDFYDLGLGVPANLAPRAIPSQARRVASFTVNGRNHTLWVAPTRDGGYCWQFTGALGGCRSARNRAKARLGVSYTNGDKNGVDFVAAVAGDITARDAHSLELDYADGTRSAVRFYYVSKPIDAGFFFAPIRAGHDTAATRASSAVLRDSGGHVLSRTTFRYESPAQTARRRAQVQAMLNRLRRQHRPPGRYRSPKLPAPTPPVQTGGDGGVTVTAGHNGVVVFDTRDASPGVRKLIAGNAGYGCFKRLPYNAGPITLTFPRSLARRVAIRLQGEMSPPFLGCVIEGGYGHRWPDRNGNHSAVEVALTPAARTYFKDRAAARDLALFIRSQTMQVVRRLTGSALASALRHDYGTKILATASPPAGRIGFTTAGGTSTFVERSPTGKRFFIRFANGRLHSQNLKPYAYPF